MTSSSSKHPSKVQILHILKKHKNSRRPISWRYQNKNIKICQLYCLLLKSLKPFLINNYRQQQKQVVDRNAIALCCLLHCLYNFVDDNHKYHINNTFGSDNDIYYNNDDNITNKTKNTQQQQQQTNSH